MVMHELMRSGRRLDNEASASDGSTSEDESASPLPDMPDSGDEEDSEAEDVGMTDDEGEVLEEGDEGTADAPAQTQCAIFHPLMHQQNCLEMQLHPCQLDSMCQSQLMLRFLSICKPSVMPGAQRASLTTLNDSIAFVVQPWTHTAAV